MLTTVIAVFGFLLSCYNTLRDFWRNLVCLAGGQAEAHLFPLSASLGYVLICTVENRSFQTAPITSMEPAFRAGGTDEFLHPLTGYELEKELALCSDDTAVEIRKLLHGRTLLPCNLPAHCVTQIAQVYYSQGGSQTLVAHNEAHVRGQEARADRHTACHFAEDAAAQHRPATVPGTYRRAVRFVAAGQVKWLDFCVKACR